MKFENPVKNLAPWFMNSAESARRLPTLPSPIRTHVEDLIRDGFTVIKGSLHKDKCVSVIENFKKFANLNNDKFAKFLDRDGHYPRIVNLHAAFPELIDLFDMNKTAYDVQEAMFGAPPSLYTSLFYERGSAQPIHRDTPYFTTKPEMFYLGVWVALEDANEQNGALDVMRGGHNIPEPDRAAIALKYFDSLDAVPSSSAALWDGFQSEVQRLCAEACVQKEQLSVQAGDTIIWHPQLPHGGGAIQDITKSRFSFVMHTTPAGTPVYHHDKFFNPEAPAELDSDRSYGRHRDSYFVKHTEVDFAHVELIPVRDFKTTANR
ncbi:phytanoyl-CoA dioxygenase family protein [Pseudomonas sp. G.S.17]|uniref:phytanoyl-CoA dioxygenase family protein n=1 Tax=Pseudomonas sp. G.S.17 TaxID=3137451 RepID=UPI00311CBF58